MEPLSYLVLSCMCDPLHLKFRANYLYYKLFFQMCFDQNFIYFFFSFERGKGENPSHIYRDSSDKVLSTLYEFLLEFFVMQILILILPFIWLSCWKIMIINNQVCVKCYLNRQSTYNLQLLFKCINSLRHCVSTTKKCSPIEVIAGIEQVCLKIFCPQKSARQTMQQCRPP